MDELSLTEVELQMQREYLLKEYVLAKGEDKIRILVRLMDIDEELELMQA